MHKIKLLIVKEATKTNKLSIPLEQRWINMSWILRPSKFGGLQVVPTFPGEVV